MTGVRKSGRRGVRAPHGNTSKRGRVIPCRKAASIAKEPPKAEAAISS